MSTRDLRLEGVTKSFGDFTAVRELSLTIPDGSFFAVLGASGCGKTTTLRMIAGLDEPTSGRIMLGDSDITHLRPYRRPINTVFQSYALFPHLSVAENVAYGLRRKGIGKTAARQQSEQMLKLVQLDGFGTRKPAQLSGGQQQRVALARALVNHPEVLLLDEPLGALDLKLRRQMQLELKRLQTEVGITFVHITHDQEEAMSMADTVAVMNGGELEQFGAPREIYNFPATAFVANFLGQSNLVEGSVTGGGDTVTVEAHGHRLAIPAERCRVTSGDAVLGIRPEKLGLAMDPDDVPAGRSGLNGVVTDSIFLGVSIQYLVQTSWGQELCAHVPNVGAPIQPGAQVLAHWDPEHAFLLERA
ncbi:ABC transporter ATP-binding protein [Nocardia seriolae]|uniref:ABC transporter ATP-binding protein YhcG n=1 Tax=Nocardia seriolae TaxID=37332 RepID=A0A0B8NQ74_9NOCA|nr:ABC transporter ATP-binding protein [Nocardia seriolae]APA97823.1 putative ABC transporter ATP-binding protein YhcG [Nocardia seriolae]MTJ64419.1 ATP-binding cassette domain-containing protein [Nocardia seriolae]MTJ75389.1 ATP-binding cassette domain-containing protein [Nocardia seriolae]MTJ87586.1 ATP-binding cassette domain-containing protein [Nocardia seriolae]MTK31578.1 ATP-binding cassette domain-containing protein [Nocardia seriolae]